MQTTQQQYDAAKAVDKDTIILFRMGDFYEALHDDAKTVSKVLGLTLASRTLSGQRVPMTGFPYHQLDAYTRKLKAGGFRFVICD